MPWFSKCPLTNTRKWDNRLNTNPRDDALCDATPCLQSINGTLYSLIGYQTQMRRLKCKCTTSAPSWLTFSSHSKLNPFHQKHSFVIQELDKQKCTHYSKFHEHNTNFYFTLKLFILYLKILFTWTLAAFEKSC